MSHLTPDPNESAGSAYDGLLEHHEVAGDSSQWAFGTDFEDPLAGVDTTVPADVDPALEAADRRLTSGFRGVQAGSGVRRKS